jgi:hypothetical protein
LTNLLTKNRRLPFVVPIDLRKGSVLSGKRLALSLLLAAAMLAGAVLMSSCGKESGGNGANAGGAALAELEASDLITTEEAEAAVGEALLDPEISSQPALGMRLAFWSAESATSFNYVQITLMTTTGLPQELRSQGYTARKNYEDTKAGIGGTDVSGLGDAAFWGGSARGMHVLKGDAYIIIMVGSSDSEQALVICKDLAAKALSRLP